MAAAEGTVRKPHNLGHLQTRHFSAFLVVSCNFDTRCHVMAVGSRLLVILGPTASGKSDAAMAVARRVGAEILSVDSMQVYRGMDVGTAKPTRAQRAEVRHHLIDVVEPN